MADVKTLDKAFHTTMQHFISTGRAPHYTEFASAMGLSVEDGRLLLHELVDSGIPAWMHPGTDYIVSFPPFNSLPTQYRISIDGQQSWFAQ